MKKAVLVIAMVLFGVGQTFAQIERGLFNHLGYGLSVGSDGIGIELAAPVTDYLALRAGVSIMPKFKYNTDVKIESNSSSFTKDKVNVEGKLNKTDFKFLLDIYPFKSSSFHLTTGAFLGPEKVVNAYNTESFLDPSEWGTAGIKIGDYRVTSDAQGNVFADLKVNSFRPYVGLGFGRAIPQSSVSFSFDAGVQFWGKPGVYTKAKDDFGNEYEKEVVKGDIDNSSTDNALDVISKITVYPVISFRLTGRFF